MKLRSEIENTHNICNHHILAPFLFLIATEKPHPKGSLASIRRNNYRTHRTQHRHRRG